MKKIIVITIIIKKQNKINNTSEIKNKQMTVMPI